MNNWDYSRVAYAVYAEDGSVLVIWPAQSDHVFRRTARWWRFPNHYTISQVFDSLDLSLYPELLPTNQPKLL